MIPSVPPAMIAPSVKLLSYPAFSMAGYMTVPIASIVTIDEPDIAAKTAHERMVATASPPGSGLVTDETTAIRRSAIEPRDITPPHRMKSGIERITSLSRPTHMSSMMSSRLPRPQKTCIAPAAARRVTSSGWRRMREHDDDGRQCDRLHSLDLRRQGAESRISGEHEIAHRRRQRSRAEWRAASATRSNRAPARADRWPSRRR